MAIPDLIPIMHEPGYRTDTIGSYADGQFFASITAGFAEGAFTGEDDWGAYKRWYTVLHRFDHDGHHLGSDIWFAGTTADGESKIIAAAAKVLHDWLGRLPKPVFGDIAVRLFQVEVDGILFGLVDETDEFGERVELYPDDLGFTEPWDGEYGT